MPTIGSLPQMRVLQRAEIEVAPQR
jgi:hypothetical protein